MVSCLGASQPLAREPPNPRQAARLSSSIVLNQVVIRFQVAPFWSITPNPQ